MDSVRQQQSFIVGYNKAEMSAGDTIYRVATFEAVNADSTFTLSQITVGDEDFAWWNGDYISTVNEYGGQDTYYTWDPDASGWFVADPDSGAPDSEQPADDVVLPLNQGVIVFSANGANLTFAGAVISGDTELYGAAGETTYTGNFTPTEITLGDIVIGAEDFAWWNGDYIATIDAFGGQDTYYTWDPDASGWFVADPDSGAPDSEQPANDVSFDPNMGFLFFTANGAALNIPSPL